MTLREDIARLVDSIPLADTHEHIMEEKLRLDPDGGSRLDDFAVLFSHYLDSDPRVAGMPADDFDKPMQRGVGVDEKWRLIKPHYLATRNTGYALPPTSANEGAARATSMATPSAINSACLNSVHLLSPLLSKPLSTIAPNVAFRLSGVSIQAVRTPILFIQARQQYMFIISQDEPRPWCAGE